DALHVTIVTLSRHVAPIVRLRGTVGSVCRARLNNVEANAASWAQASAWSTNAVSAGVASAGMPAGAGLSAPARVNSERPGATTPSNGTLAGGVARGTGPGWRMSWPVSTVDPNTEPATERRLSPEEMASSTDAVTVTLSTPGGTESPPTATSVTLRAV